MENFKLDKSSSSSWVKIPCNSLNVHSKYFFDLSRLSPSSFLLTFTWLFHPGNVKLMSFLHKNASSFSLIVSVMMDGCPIFWVFSGTFDHAESNLIFFGVAWMESSNKAFGMTCLWVGSLGKLFFWLCWDSLKRMEKTSWQ